MNLVKGKCPNCGAAININSMKDIAICEYCNTPYVVEKAINNININVENATFKNNTCNINSINNMNVNSGNIHINNVDNIEQHITNIKKGPFSTIAEGVSKAIEIKAKHEAKKADEFNKYIGPIVITLLFFLIMTIIFAFFYSTSISSRKSLKNEADSYTTYNNSNNYNVVYTYEIYSGPTSPSEEDVITCLESINDIIDIEAVTEDNDINNQLNKSGGYSSDIFFTVNYLDDTYVLLDSDGNIKKPLVVGTNGGGSIEIYASISAAENRCKYLDSIRYAIMGEKDVIIGTCVVRISQQLTVNQQEAIFNEILEQLNTLK